MAVSNQQAAVIKRRDRESEFLPTKNRGSLAIHGYVLYDIDYHFTIYALSHIDFGLAEKCELHFGF